MTDYAHLRVEHIYSFDEASVQQYAEMMGEDSDETEYKGLNPETIASLLDSVGSRGDNPLIATILYHAGIELVSYANLYGRYSDYAQDGTAPKVFGVYVDGATVQRDSVPDALLLAMGFNRKAYRGYEDVQTDLWVNPDSPYAGASERDLRDASQKAMLSGDYDTPYIFAEQDTEIHELGDPEGRILGTVAERGIKPEEYGGCEPVAPIYDRMARLNEVSTKEGAYHQLLKELQELYAALNLDVEEIDFEGAELYELSLYDSEIEALNKRGGFQGTDSITGLSIRREDRPIGHTYEPRDEDEDVFYTNGWGDMTVIIQIERESVATSYTLTVFMEGGYGIHLEKRTVEVQDFQTVIQRGAAHLLSLIEDPLDTEMKLNDIDEFEYNALVTLVRSIKSATTPA